MPLKTRATCPLCGSTERQELLSLPYDSKPLQQFLQEYYKGAANLGMLAHANYTIDRCTRCHGMWQREILDEGGMKELYERWIEPEGSKGKRENPQRRLHFARHCARLLHLFPKPEETLLLDYGAGWGDWCEVARVFGFEVHAVELSVERIGAMKEKGIPAFLPNDLPNNQYDFIYLEQVLEHVPDPKDLIKTLTGMLKEHGYIHIGVPNGRDVASQTCHPQRLLRKGAAQPLEHINIFTRKSLITFMHSFHCFPVRQRESLLRCTSLKYFLHDCCLSLARCLPPGIFPPGTSLLFQRRSKS